MSKIIKTVAIIAVAVAIVVYAAPIAAALAAAAGSIGVTVAAAGIASALVGMGLSLGLTAAMGMFRKTPNMSQAIADRLNTSVVPSTPRKIVFGTTSGGQDVRFFEGDVDLPNTKKDGYAQVIALASHRISAFNAFYAENDLIWSNGSWIAKRDGFANANPLRFVLEGASGNGFAVGSGRYWNSSATFTGCAYYSLFWRLDAEGPFPSGPPARLTAIIDGCPLYDPRRDSTRGGSGPHRLENQATWTFTESGVQIGRNPALALLTYLIGYRINGRLVWGMGIPADRIDFDNFRNYANICEEQVATQAGSTVQRYTCDTIYSTADTHETVISGITAAMGSCKLSDRGGLYGLIGGYDDTAGPKIAFDENDLVAAGGGASPYVWNPAPPARDRFNIVRGRFADPANLYQLTDWGDPIEIEALPDNVPRVLTLDLGAVSRAETCQRIAKQFLLREAKTPGNFTALFGPKGFAVQVGSVITLSLPSEGWNNKLFRVIEQAETHDLLFQMTLREEDPAIYAWDREEKPLPAIVRPQGYDPSTTITPVNLALATRSYEGANRYNVSEVDVTWTPEDSGRVAGIQIQSRPLGETGWTEQAALYNPKAGLFTFSSNAPGIQIEVQARYRMANAIYSPWVSANIQTAPVVITTDFDNITGPNRPANNATVGAPAGTYIGDRPVTDVLTALDSAGQGAAADRAAAAQAARDALNARTIADAQASLATQRAQASDEARTAAQTARDASQEARDAAQQSAIVASSVANTSLARNPVFALYPTATGYPDSWTVEATGPVPTRVPGESGVGYGVRTTCDANNQAYFRTDLANNTMGAVKTGDWLVFEADVRLNSGSLVGAGVLFRALNTDSSIAQETKLTFSTDRDASGTLVGNGLLNTTYRFRKLLQVTNAGSGRAILYTMAHWSGLGSIATANDLTWYRNSVRPATDQEVATQKVVLDHGTTLARLVVEETTRATQTGALVTRANALEASINNPVTGLTANSARIAAEETARATHDSAIALRASALEAKSQASANLLSNTDFVLGTEGWGSATDTNIAYGRDYAGDGQRPMPEHNLGIYQVGVESRHPYWFSPMFAVEGGQWYECSAYLAAHRANCQVYIQAFDSAGNYLNNYAPTSIGGEGNASGSLNGYNHRWNKQQLPSNAARAHLIFQKQPTINANGWTDSYAWMTRPYVGRCSASQTEPTVFSHGPSSLGAVTTNARIAAEETVRSGADSALSNRTGSLETKVGTHNSSDIVARIALEETTRAGADGALSTRTGSLESLVGGHSSNAIVARIANEETTRANAVSSVAQRTTTIESRITARPNLLPNGDFANGLRGWSGNANWYAGPSPYWGNRAQADSGFTSSVSVLNSDPFAIAGGGTYTISADLLHLTGASAPSAYIDLVFLDAAGNVASDGPERLRAGQFDFANDNVTRDAIWSTAVAPGNANRAIARAVFQANNGRPAILGVRQFKVEMGNGPYTTFSNEATVVQNAGTLIDTRNRVSTAWLENTVQAGAGYAALKLRADGISNTSAISLVAGSISLDNQVNGGTIPALKVENGNAVFSGRLQVNGGVISSPDGKARFDLSGARIVFNQNGYMKVTGSGFGSSGQFIDWFGPSYVDVNQCTETTAISYLKTNGDAYFGGKILEGQLRTQKTTTVTSDNQIAVGPFASNGKPRTYTATIFCERTGQRHSTYDDAGAFSANFSIEKLQDNGSWVELAGGGAMSYVYSNGIGGDGSAFATASEPGSFSQSGSGSISFVDNSGGLGPLTIRARLHSLSLPGVSGQAHQQDKTDYYLRISTFEA